MLGGNGNLCLEGWGGDECFLGLELVHASTNFLKDIEKGRTNIIRWRVGCMGRCLYGCWQWQDGGKGRGCGWFKVVMMDCSSDGCCICWWGWESSQFEVVEMDSSSDRYCISRWGQEKWLGLKFWMRKQWGVSVFSSSESISADGFVKHVLEI